MRTKKIAIAALAASLLLAPALAYAFTAYFTTSDTLTVGVVFQVATPTIFYDTNPTFTSGLFNSCTQGTFPAWSCPTTGFPATIFAGDNISYGVQVESDKASTIPTFTITGGTGLTITHYYVQESGEGGSRVGSVTSGLPTMTAGTWYLVWAVATVGASTPTGSLVLSASLGA